MVNMNAAGDKENEGSNQNKNTGTNGDTKASSTTGHLSREESERITQRVNGSSLQTESNSHPITNGAYPKTSSIYNTRPPDFGGDLSGIVNGSSCTERGIINEGESEKGLLCNVVGNVGTSGHSAGVQRQPNRANSNYDMNSSSEDEECCIYTYRGDADLPSSFFRMDLRQGGNSRNSSPDMDYLEMDFDPGPSNDRDSSEAGSECDELHDDEQRSSARVPPFIFQLREEERPVGPGHSFQLPREEEVRAISPNPVSPLSTPSPVLLPVQQSHALPDTGVLPGPSFSQPLSPVAPVLPSSASAEPLCCCVTAKRSQSPTHVDENFNEGEGEAGTVIWKEQEAIELQTCPVGPLDSGATAVINTLAALKVACCPSDVHREIGGPQHDPDSLVGFLLWRATAGATHRDVARTLTAVQRPVCARFFRTHPRRHVNLTGWLAHWIRQGAVPIVSLRGASGWQHQMVSGVGPHGVALVGPREHRAEVALWPALSAPPTLQVPRDEVLSWWHPDTSTSLLELADPSLPPAWRTLNVLGQVVGVVREGSRSVRSHVTIPTGQECGVTLAMLVTNPACDSLRRAPELPTHPAATQTTHRAYVTSPVM